MLSGVRWASIPTTVLNCFSTSEKSFPTCRQYSIQVRSHPKTF